MAEVILKRNYRCDSMAAVRASRERTGEQRPGGRAARVRSSILVATSELLGEAGYDGLSVEEIASRACVHKTTIYRRWPTLPELVADSVAAHAEAHVRVPDTGDFLGDLRALARDVVTNLSSPSGSRLTKSIIAAAVCSPDVASKVYSFWSARMEATGVIVERAIERGQIAPDSDPHLIIQALVAPIWLRTLVTGELVDSKFADRLAEFTAAGVLRQTAT